MLGNVATPAKESDFMHLVQTGSIPELIEQRDLISDALSTTYANTASSTGEIRNSMRSELAKVLEARRDLLDMTIGLA